MLITPCITPSIAKERVVGWYHTGPRLRASDLQINEVIKRFVGHGRKVIAMNRKTELLLAKIQTPKPVMVIIDPRQRESGSPTDAYFAVEEIKDVSQLTRLTNVQILIVSDNRMERQRKRHSCMSLQR
jgi:26S proteasome regulatory subunit N8